VVVDLLSIAVYYAFPFALGVFAAGFIYRITRLFMMRGPPRVMAPRRKRSIKQLVVGFVRTFLDPIIVSFKKNKLDFIFGLVALHILGTIPLLFLLAQHMAFFEYYFKPYGILKPLAISLSPTTSAIGAVKLAYPVKTTIHVKNIWGPLNVLLNGDVASLMVLVGVGYKLGDKLAERARGTRCIRPWDWLSLIILAGVVLTGFAAAHHVFGSEAVPTSSLFSYRGMLGLHVFLASTLLALIPFTNYWHIAFAYFYGKLREFWDLRYRKGVV